MPSSKLSIRLLVLAALALPACQKAKTGGTKAPGVGVATPAAPERPFDYQMTELDNGMKVITLEDHSTPIAAVQLWYHVGSKDEKPNRRGFAHMFEHMMFRGTENIGPKAHFEYIRKVGGEANAYTSFDNTTYIQVVPSNQVEMVLWLEAERMGFLKINQGYYDTERKVVAEEYRMGREQPYGTVPDKLLPQVFDKHPYAWTPIGDMDELQAANADELQTFWNTYYVPNNAALVVVGDVKHAEVEALAKQYFGWIPKYPEPPRVTVKEPEQTAPKQIVIPEHNGPVPIVGIGYRTVPIGAPDELALEALGKVLGGGESSRLYRRLVTDQRLAMFALSAGFALEDDGIFAAGAVLKPMSGKADVTLKVIREEIERLRKDGPTDAELEKAKNGMLRDLTAAQLTVESKAQRLGEAALIEGDIENANRELAGIRALDKAALQKAAQRWLVPAHEIEIRVEPNLLGFIAKQLGGDAPKKADDATGKGKEVIAGEGSGKPGLKRPDTLGTAPKVAPPQDTKVAIATQEQVLKNGLRVVVLENHEVPFVQFELGLRYGAFADPADKPGVAYLALPMLGRGTTKHDYKTFTDELDRRAIQLSGSADMDGATVSADAVTDQAEPALGLLAEAVLTPSFSKSELEHHVDQVITGLMVTERSPDYLADRELRKRLFGAHPYARVPEGQAAGLHAIDRDMLAKWWSTYARPDTSVLYVAGDVDAKQAFAWAEQHLGGWKATGTAPKIDIAAPAAIKGRTIVLVDKPGEQAQIRVGHLGITRDDPRWPTVRVLSDVFGGGFASRLNDTIRVKKGLTYGAGGGFSSGRFAGRFVIRTFSKNATVGETVRTILDEITRLQKEPPSAEELAVAQSYITGSYARERETTAEMIDELWSLDLAGLPRDWFDRYLSAVRTVDTKGLDGAADQLVGGKDIVIVVVGSAKVLEPQLRQLGKVTVIKP
ncbi:MAG: insulinase family protein [Deltaproteobacteria bacterium]|nr:insulinase family protein [Nannocystaceae bacterium]